MAGAGWRWPASAAVLLQCCGAAVLLAGNGRLVPLCCGAAAVLLSSLCRRLLFCVRRGGWRETSIYISCVRDASEISKICF